MKDSLSRISLGFLACLFIVVSTAVICMPHSALATVLFYDDFESGDFSKWDFVWRDGEGVGEESGDGQCITNNGTQRGVCSPSSRAHSGQHAFQDHYVMSASGDAHNDNNHILEKGFANLTHWFIRGYIYFPADLQWCGQSPTGDDGLQRKLIYFKGTGWDATDNIFGFVLGSWSNNACNGGYFRIGYGGAGGVDASIDTIANFIAGQWYSIELEVVFGSSVAADTLRFWVNGVQVLNRSNLTIRSSYGVSHNIGLGTIELGRQVDRYHSNPFDEYRYWDDIVVADSYVGPIVTTPPAAPSGLSVN